MLCLDLCAVERWGSDARPIVRLVTGGHSALLGLTSGWHQGGTQCVISVLFMLVKGGGGTVLY